MNIAATELQDDLDELESAEDFLGYFGIDFEPSVVHVNRLHILQRYHDYLEGHRQRHRAEPDHEEYRSLLTRAYADFVHSDARTEKVLRVHQKAGGIAKVAVSSIGRISRG
ncbi:MAG: nitrogenase-stabilizing/protective protein NifW [Sulfurisoma sp.]|nr:nitrogenase-stabilizing/protective protein NifW [Sulfurisoma sp.]